MTNTIPNVPRELLADLLGNDHDKRIMAERHLLAMLANAPSPAGVYSSDPLACPGCASGCFRCASPADHVEVVRAMVVPKCKCSMSISVLGDGCRYCQPQEYIDRIHDQMEDDRAMVVPDGYALVLIEPTIEMAESMYFDGEDYTNSKDFDDFKIAWPRLLAVAASGDSK